MKVKLLFLMSLLVGFVSCNFSQGPAEKVAKEFIEAYYVKADFAKASSLADGLALAKLVEGIQLREGQAIDSSSHQPKVSTQLIHADSNDASSEGSHFLFKIKIQPPQVSPFLKKARLTLRERGDKGWRVTQFQDYDE